MNATAPLDTFDEWLGKLPSGWSLKKVGREFKVVGSGTTPPTENPAWYGDGYPWVTTGELRETLITETEKSVTEEAIRAFTTLRRYQPGSLLVAMYGATIGRTGILGCEATTNQACCAMAEPIGLEPRYVYYWLQAFREQLIRKASGGGQPNVNQDTIRELRISSPDRQLQQSIANFLDAQTARIDALIAEKERLQAAVTELFRARLGTAVVEGVGAKRRLAAAPNKGFSLVREDWALVPLKYIASSSGGMTPSKDNMDFWGRDIPWVSPKDMKRFVLHGSEDHITEAALAATSLKLQPVGSVLVVVRGMILAHTFPVATNAVPVTINQDMKALRAIGRVSAQYLAWMLRGLQPLILSLTEESAHGTKALRTDQWANQPVPVPSTEEQNALVAQFEKWEEETNDLSVHLSEHIARLREYRSSLISAAVTGQIDISSYKMKVS